MHPLVFPSVVLSVLLLILLSSTVLGQQQVKWAQMQGQRGAQLAPLPLLFQNGQGVPKQAQRMPGQERSKISTGPVLGGKIHLLSTLWRGLRNTGLEASIAGDVLERVVKVTLRDLLVPFKRDVILPLMP